MSFFEELKRRNVIRVAIAYAVGAWLLLQLTDVLLELLSLPDTAGRYVILLLIIGFPLALFFAWAFEMTPDGIKREAEVDRTQSITNVTGRKLDRTIMGIMAVALAFFVYERFSAPEPVTQAPVATTASTPGGSAETPFKASEPSIAVLPFVNMSADPEQEYFSDGISEELLNLLVRVDGLKVASRTSSFTYKGENRNIPEIASELKVDHILEGSVRKSGNRVRITAQLIDTGNDRHLWSDTFDRELDDIFAIQDEIANAIVEALKSELGIGLKQVNVEATTENLDAYDLYLKARGLFIARQNLDESIRLFEKATELDPEFALAWEGLAAVQSVADSWLASDGIDHSVLAMEAAKKALEIDPGLSMAYAVIAQTPSANRDALESLERFDVAIENDPKNATAFLWRALTFSEIGYLDQAIADLKACLAIDPGYMNCKQHLAKHYLYQGNTDEGIRLFEETLEENFHSTDDEFVAYYALSGQRVIAVLLGATPFFGPYSPVKDWVDAILNPEQDQSARLARWQRWAKNSNLDECDLGAVIAAFKLDHCFGRPDKPGSYQLMWRPDVAYFRKTQRFKDIMSGYAMSYWQKHGFPPQCRNLGDGDFECE